jgi:hypothetical protein
MTTNKIVCLVSFLVLATQLIVAQSDRHRRGANELSLEIAALDQPSAKSDVLPFWLALRNLGSVPTMFCEVSRSVFVRVEQPTTEILGGGFEASMHSCHDAVGIVVLPHQTHFVLIAPAISRRAPASALIAASLNLRVRRPSSTEWKPLTLERSVAIRDAYANGRHIFSVRR